MSCSKLRMNIQVKQTYRQRETLERLITEKKTEISKSTGPIDSCFHMRAKVRNLNDIIWIAQFDIIRMPVFWTVCFVGNSNDGPDGPDHHLNCIIQITHRCVSLHTHCPKYRHWNDHSNCALLLSCKHSLWCVNKVCTCMCWIAKFDECIYTCRYPKWVRVRHSWLSNWCLVCTWISKKFNIID